MYASYFVGILAFATSNAVQYEMILNHIDYRDGLFSSNLPSTGLENENNASANTYSVIGTFDATKRSQYRDAPGAYQFKLVYYYRNDTVDTLIWKQTSWITEQYITGFSIISATGNDGTVFAVNQNNAAYDFMGLGLNAGIHSDYDWLDGDGAASSSFYQSVACMKIWSYLGSTSDGIPAMYQRERASYTNWALGQTLYIAFTSNASSKPPTTASSTPSNYPSIIATDSPSNMQTESPTKRSTKSPTSTPSILPTGDDQGNDTEDDQSGQAVETTKDEQVEDEEVSKDQANDAAEPMSPFDNIVYIILAVVACCCFVGIIAFSILCQNQRKKGFVDELDALKKPASRALYQRAPARSTSQHDDGEIMSDITLGEENDSGVAMINVQPQNATAGNETTTATGPVIQTHPESDNVRSRQRGVGSNEDGEEECLSVEDEEVLQFVDHGLTQTGMEEDEFEVVDDDDCHHQSMHTKR